MSDDLLWHYTTSAGLIGIIEKNCLWATNVFYLNDSTEFMHGISIAKDILQRIKNKLGDDEKERMERFEKDLSYISPTHNRPVYVSCLSTAKDELSQWRAYSKGGGFSIGFPRDELKKSTQKQKPKFDLKECIYDENKQKEIINDLIKKIAIPCIENPETLYCVMPRTPQEISALVCQRSNEFIWELYHVCSTLKHPSFEREEEWRLVLNHGYVSEIPKDQLKFRSNNGVIIPYACIQLPSRMEPDKSDNKEDVEFWRKVQIVIGPTQYKNELKNSLHLLFRKFHSMEPQIFQSEIPYREF